MSQHTIEPRLRARSADDDSDQDNAPSRAPRSLPWWVWPAVLALGASGPAALAAAVIGYWCMAGPTPDQGAAMDSPPVLPAESDHPTDPAPLVAEQLHAPQRDDPPAERPLASDVPPPADAPRPKEVEAELAPPPKTGFFHRNTLSERDLLAALSQGEAVGLRLGSERSQIYMHYKARVDLSNRNSGGKQASDAAVLVAFRPDLSLLPIFDGPSRQLTGKAALELGVLSRKMHAYLKTIAPVGNDGRRLVTVLGEQLREDMRGKKPEWIRPEAVPTLSQILVAEDEPGRKLLVEVMAGIPGKAATVVLAGRAAFDLSPKIREQAVAALKGRPAEHWRPILVEALRYPWPPPADFAAEALVELKDQDAIPDLVHLLSKPHAGRPFTTPGKRRVIREMVRIDHRANCLICHPPALTGKEPVVGLDPLTILPPSYKTDGIRTPGIAEDVSLWVRADITFLRPDFSVSLPLVNEAVLGRPGPVARFDFVVRTRPVQREEKKKWDGVEDKTDFQREAVLFALRELSERDEGDTPEAWVAAYPLADAEVRSRKLADALIRADSLTRGALVLRYRDAEGMEHAWALAKAIPRLGTVPAQELGRNALVNRFVRLPADELRTHLKDRDAEVRRAAIQACAAKGDRELEADLTALLKGDATTAALARAALKKLAGG